MNNYLPDIPRVYTALAEWLACLMMLIALPPRLPKRRRWLTAGAFLLVQATFLQLTGQVPLAWWIPCMAVAVALMYAMLWLCCDISPYVAGYACAQVFILAEFAASLHWQIFCLLMPQTPPLSLASQAAVLVGYGILYTGVALVFIPRWRTMPQITAKSLAIAVLTAVTVFAVSNLGFLTADGAYTGISGYGLYYIRTLVDFCGQLILTLYSRQLREAELRHELDMMDNTLHRQYDQYKQSKENLRLLNRRYHDLKVQIAAIRAEQDPGRQARYLNELESGLARFEAENKTGNLVLDTVLTTKNLYCSQHGISMTCVANGKLLDFLSTMDICTIFGVALDNAIEAVRPLPADHRLIRVAVFAEKGFLMIRLENPCPDAPAFAEGLPVSTKPEAQRDYGLKSVRRVAEKYGGSMTTHVEDDWFYLRVLLPLPART